MPSATPELRALAAAVARACGVERPPVVPTGLDWEEVARLARRHDVAALAHRGMETPDRELAAAAERAMLRSLHFTVLQGRLLRALHDAGVPALVLKGLALAAEAGGDPAVRATRDVDLLVPAGDIGVAVDAVRAAGLEWYGWRRPKDPDRPPVEPDALARLDRLPLLRDVKLTDHMGALVELHWRLFDNSRLMPVDPAWFAEPHTVVVHGAEVPTLPVAVHLAYVLVHGTNHLWSLMKWLADVPMLVTRRPDLADPRMLSRAGAGNDRSLATGLIVAERVFGPFLPPATRGWARGVGGTTLLVRRSLGALAAPEDRAKTVGPRGLPAEAAGRLALRPEPAYKREELRLLLLGAGRAHAIEDPSTAELVTGPLRWLRRTARRRVR
ncbi:MAG TPA: nucleotidyltransferase family protein [Solirubrobacteraceae bacterium]